MNAEVREESVIGLDSDIDLCDYDDSDAEIIFTATQTWVDDSEEKRDREENQSNRKS